MCFIYSGLKAKLKWLQPEQVLVYGLAAMSKKKSPKNDEQTKAHAEYIQCFLCDAHLSANTPPHPKQQIKHTAKGGNENQALWSGDEKSKIEPLILFFFFLPHLIHERHIPLNPTQGCSRRAFTSSHNAGSCEGLLK